MAQAGYTPIQLYYSTTTTNAPTAGNLASGELAINITDGKLFYKDNGGSVQVIAWKTTPTTAGGTGLTSWTAGDLPYYATGTALSKLGIGTNGQILTSTGTAPQWSTLSGVAVTTFSAGTTGFTPSSATSGAVTLAGTLATTNGGTGLTSFTANGVVYASSTSALTTGSALTFNGTVFGVTGSAQITTTSGIGYLEAYGGSSFKIRSSGTMGVESGAGSAVALLGDTQVTFSIGGSEQMRLTSTGLGIGTSSPGARLSVVNAISAGNIGTSFQQEIVNNNGAGVGDWTGTIYRWLPNNANTNQAYIGAIVTSAAGDTLSDLVFGVKNSTTGNTIVEAMRIKQGDVGIGTNSPSQKLEVAGNILINTSGNPTMTVKTSGAGNNPGYLLTADTNTWGMYGIFSDANDTMQWQYNGTSRLTLTNDGNLGLGVTPSAWSSSAKALEIGIYAGFYRNASGITAMSFNSYQNTSNIDTYRVSANAATKYEMAGGHAWYVAPSGTAGNAISFTQAMTLDCGTAVDRTNLLVGTTSGFSSAAGRGNISVNGSSDAIVALGFGGTRKGYLYAAGSQVNVGSDGFMVFETGGSERARITSAGNLVIGQTTATSRLTVNSNMDITDGTINVRVSQSGGSALIGTTTNHPFFFMTNDTERARITSVGNLSLGGTADRGTTVGSAALQLFNGTAPAGTLTNGVSLYSQSGDLRFMDAAGNAYQVGFRNVPQSGSAKTGSYTLATTDVGEYIQVGSGGSVTIPDATFATGDVVSVFNNTTGNITITCSITTAYIAGTDSDKATMTLATRGVATILFISSTVCVVTGNVT